MADIASLQNQLRQWRDYYSTQPNGEQQLYQKVAQYAQRQGLGADVVGQVIQGVAPNPESWGPVRVQSLLDQYSGSSNGDLTSLQNQLRQWRDYYSTQPNGQEKLYEAVANYANQNGLGADLVNEVIQGVAPNPGAWNPGRVQTLLNQYRDKGIANGIGLPPNFGSSEQYGLSGAQGALTEGLRAATNSVGSGALSAANTLRGGQSDAMNSIGTTRGQVRDVYGRAQQDLIPFTQAGVGANNLQAALSGALGPEAQSKAFAQYRESPGVDFARQQSERAITRNAAALGGLGSGNVMRELSDNAVGLYLQDFNNQFGRLGQVADRGFSSAGTSAGLRGQEAGLQAGLGQFAANIPLSVSTQIADLTTGAANTIGGMNFSTGNNLGAVRYQAGQDLANSAQSVSTALSALINQQGAGMTDIIGNTTTNLNTLYQQASQGDSQAIQQLQAMLGNLSTGGANTVAGLPIIPGQTTNYLGQLGQVAGGIGGACIGFELWPAARYPVCLQPGTE